MRSVQTRLDRSSGRSNSARTTIEHAVAAKSRATGCQTGITFGVSCRV